MRITLQLFSHLRFITGQRQMELELTEGATVGDALTALVERYPEARPVLYYRGGLGIRLVLNGQDARTEEPLSEGAELALLPPVGGGLW